MNFSNAVKHVVDRLGVALGMLILAGMVVLLVTGCASQEPVIYPGDGGSENQAQIRADIDECIDFAHASGAGDQRSGEIATRTARNTAVGAGTGAVVGAIAGDAGRGAAIGAATTSVGTLLRSAFKSSKPNSTHKRFVNRCLKKKGYAVVGWS